MPDITAIVLFFMYFLLISATAPHGRAFSESSSAGEGVFRPAPGELLFFHDLDPAVAELRVYDHLSVFHFIIGAFGKNSIVLSHFERTFRRV